MADASRVAVRTAKMLETLQSLVEALTEKVDALTREVAELKAEKQPTANKEAKRA